MATLASVGAGISEGASRAFKYEQGREERDLRLAEAKSRKELSDLKMSEYKAQAPQRQLQSDVQTQQLQNQLFKSQQEGLRAKTYSAFDRFSADGNVKHLNTFLADAKNNPAGRNLYGDVARLDKVTRTPEVERTLQQQGITDIDGYFSEVETDNNVLATMTDGTQQLVDMDNMYAMTGYTNYMTDQELERLSKRSLIAQRMRSGQSVERLTALERVAKQKAEVEGIPYHQAYQELQNKGSKVQGTENERLAKQLMEQNPELSYVDAYEQALAMKKEGGSQLEREARRIAETEGKDYQEVFDTLKQEGERTSGMKEEDAVTEAKQQLEDSFEGKYFDTDFSIPENRRKAADSIRRIERLGKLELSNEDKRTARQMRQLTSLGQTASEEITNEEAGPIDSLMRSVSKYISDNVEGTNATSSYETFRNTLRHALYGATLTQGEINAFNKAAGSLAEQQGPVLAKLKTQLQDLKTQLTSLYDLNDEHVVKYRLGMDLDQVDDVVAALEERIDMLDGVPGQTVKPVVRASSTPLPPGERPSLEEIFK